MDDFSLFREGASFRHFNEQFSNDNWRLTPHVILMEKSWNKGSMNRSVLNWRLRISSLVVCPIKGEVWTNSVEVQRLPLDLPPGLQTFDAATVHSLRGHSYQYRPRWWAMWLGHLLIARVFEFLLQLIIKLGTFPKKKRN